MKTPIEFLEKPVTDDELKIAAVIKMALYGFESADREILYSIFAPDATVCEPIKNYSKIDLNRDQYIENYIKSRNSIRAITYKNVLIRVLDEQKAIASYTCSILLKDASWPVLLLRQFNFVKRDGSWLIEKISAI